MVQTVLETSRESKDLKRKLLLLYYVNDQLIDSSYQTKMRNETLGHILYLAWINYLKS